MLQRREVHSNLMRAPGVELDFHQRRAVDLCEGTPVRARFARMRDVRAVPRFALCRHARAMDGVAPDGQLDSAALLSENALHERDIRFLDGPLAKSLAKFRVRRVVLGDQDHARGFLVQAMNDSRPQWIPGLRKRLPAPRSPMT